MGLHPASCCGKYTPSVVLLDFNLLLKNYFLCVMFVSYKVLCKVPMFVLQFLPTMYDDPALDVSLVDLTSLPIKLLTVQYIWNEAQNDFQGIAINVASLQTNIQCFSKANRIYIE